MTQSLRVCFGGIFLLLLLAGEIKGCGVTTHNLVAHRAWKSLPPKWEYAELIEMHQDAFQNGAAFPDFGYDCFLKSEWEDLPSLSETAHWPPFQNATITYIHKTYPQPWTIHAQKLVVFLLGLTSHSVADVLWHDLTTVSHTQQGFISGMASVDIGSWDEAHTISDTGGEFCAAKETELRFLRDIWFLPADDLANIFELMGYQRPLPDVIRACNEELFAEVMGIRTLSLGDGRLDRLYKSTAKLSPFLVKHYEDYWLGGIRDMSVWTSECWPFLTRWLGNESATPPQGRWCMIEEDGDTSWRFVPFEEQSKGVQRHWLAKVSLHQRLRYCGDTSWRFVPFEEQPKGVQKHWLAKVSLHQRLGKELSSVGLFPLKEHIKRKGDFLSFSPLSSLSSSKELKDESKCVKTSSGGFIGSNVYQSYFGHSLTSGDFDGDLISDIVVSAPAFRHFDDSPMRGAAFLIYGNRDYNPTTQIDLLNSSTIFRGDNFPEAKFGWDVTSLDFNLDGVLDLVVSAPGEQQQNMTYLGKVYVFFGNSSLVRGGPDSNCVLTISPFSNPVSYVNFGQFLKAQDLNSDGHPDLIIGSPYAPNGDNLESGVLRGFFSSSSSSSSLCGLRWDWEMSDFYLGGETAFLWFGNDAVVGQKGLYIGAPISKGENNSYYASGTLYGPSSLSIHSDEERGYFAEKLSFGSPFEGESSVLGVSAPSQSFGTVEQSGKVYLFNETCLHEFRSSQKCTLAEFVTNREFALFGWKTGFDKISSSIVDDFWISSPLRDSLPHGPRCGALYIWKGGKGTIPQNGDIVMNPETTSSFCVHGDVGHSMYGYDVSFLDFNGNGISDVILSAPRNSDLVQEGGAISIIYDIPDY